MQALSRRVLHENYLLPGELDADAVFGRVATSLAQESTQAQRFLWAMRRGLIPGGRIAAGAGAPFGMTLMNCFVQPVPNPTTSSPDSCLEFQRSLAEAATTLNAGGGIGYNFSAIRPRSSHPLTQNEPVWGPIECMTRFEAMCETLRSRHSRRGAQMAVLRCDHPDIEAFIQ